MKDDLTIPNGGERRPRPVLLWALVAAAIAAISCASLFIRLCTAPAVTIAFYRVAIAALILAPTAFRERRRQRPGGSGNGAAAAEGRRAPPASAALSILAGVLLAAHFLFWISSLQQTSVASSVALVSLTPLFAALIAWGLLQERPGAALWLGLAAAIAGSLVIAGLDFSLTPEALFGDLLALGGALAAAGYFLCGRRLRRTIGVGGYACTVYGAAALALAPACLLFGAPFSGFDSQTWTFLVLLALVPQLIGHTTFNWALRFLPATLVAVLTLGEPLGATLLAYLFLGETVSAAKGLGLALLFAGILASSVGTSAAARGGAGAAASKAAETVIDRSGQTH